MEEEEGRKVIKEKEAPGVQGFGFRLFRVSSVKERERGV